MSSLFPVSPVSFLGRAWSAWPPESQNELNIVSGIRKISHDIVSLCLIESGADPIHPDYGLAPKLFDPLSGYTTQYFIYSLEQSIGKWISGISQHSVSVSPVDRYINSLAVQVLFVPIAYPDASILTFGYYEWQGAVWNKDLTTFLNGVGLNDSPFSGLG